MDGTKENAGLSLLKKGQKGIVRLLFSRMGLILALTAGAVGGSTPEYGESINEATVDITPTNFAVDQNGNITNKTVQQPVIKDANGADVTTKFTVTTANLTKNKVAAEQKIKNNGADAGIYTATFSAGNVSVDVKFTVAKAEIANANDLTLTLTSAPTQGRVAAPASLTAGTYYSAAYQWNVAGKDVEVGDPMFTGDKVILTVTLTADSNHKFASNASSTVDLTANSPNSAKLDKVAADGSTLTLTYTWDSIS